MISPAFFVASMVGFHVEFSHSMYSSKWPYSTPISCTRVTGPSVYWRSSWARALSGSEEAARHMHRIIGLIIFYAPVVMYLYEGAVGERRCEDLLVIRGVVLVNVTPMSPRRCPVRLVPVQPRLFLHFDGLCAGQRCGHPEHRQAGDAHHHSTHCSAHAASTTY